MPGRNDEYTQYMRYAIQTLLIPCSWLAGY